MSPCLIQPYLLPLVSFRQILFYCAVCWLFRALAPGVLVCVRRAALLSLVGASTTVTTTTSTSCQVLCCYAELVPLRDRPALWDVGVDSPTPSSLTWTESAV